MTKQISRSTFVSPTKLIRGFAGLLILCSAMMAMPSMATLTITSPANRSVYCLGEALAAGQLTMTEDSHCATETDSPVVAWVGQVSVSIGGTQPNYVNTADVILQEAGWKTVTASDDCGGSDSIDIAVVKLSGISVSGAVNVGSINWAVVKTTSATDWVYVTADLIPNDPIIAAAALSWSGGQACTDPLQRCVPKNDSKKTTVTVSCCSSSFSANVWILWATLEIRTSETKSPGNNKSAASGTGGDKLGPLTDEDDGITRAEAIGKIEAVGTLSPAGVALVIPNDWDIKRWLVAKGYSNGSPTTPVNRDDTTFDAYKDVVPDVDTDKIYDLDGPSCGFGFTIVHTRETYANFRQWVTWKGTKCSEEVTWHYQARVDDDLDPTHRNSNGTGNDDTELNDVDVGTIAIPNTAHYMVR